MAGLFICQSSCQKFLPTSKNVLGKTAKGVPNNNSSIFVLTFYALALAFAPGPGSVLVFTNKLFKQYIKAYLKD